MEYKELEAIANEARKLTIKTVYEVGAGHLGGPLSAIDIIVALYNNIMNVDPDNKEFDNRDRFVLSKGHSAISLYAVMALRGYFDVEEMNTFDSINSRLQAHPDMTLLPGLEMSTGSLGQGLSNAVGMALAAKLKNQSFTTYCMIGDGESQEGNIWEAADMASRHCLDNLVVFLDNNKLQQYGFSIDGKNQLFPIEKPISKWESFGWNVAAINGNSMKHIISAINQKRNNDRPTIIIANTVKGKGVSFMENNALWHSKIPTEQEYKIAIKELEEFK